MACVRRSRLRGSTTKACASFVTLVFLGACASSSNNSVADPPVTTPTTVPFVMPTTAKVHKKKRVVPTTTLAPTTVAPTTMPPPRPTATFPHHVATARLVAPQQPPIHVATAPPPPAPPPPPPPPSPAPAGAVAAMVAGINAFRAAHGLAPLAVHPNLASKAQAWANHMAYGGCGMSNGVPNICHSQLSNGITVQWSLLEENVGMVNPPNTSNMESAFEHSPEHAANMLNSKIQYVGVGVAYDGNYMYVAEEFMAG